MNRALFRIPVFLILLMFSAGCSTPPLDPPPVPTPVPGLAGTDPVEAPAADAPVMSIPEVAPAVEQTPADETPVILSQAEIENLVLAEVSARNGLAASEARIILSEQRRWPDQGLGCNARPGVFEPRLAPGYLIQVEANGQTFEYHTDLHGTILFCPADSKPMDPIR